MFKSFLKTSKVLSIFVAGGVLAISIIIHSCVKENPECKECESKKLTTNTKVNINDRQLLAYSDYNNSNPETVMITKTEDENIKITIQNLISSIGIAEVNSDYPIALCLFFQDTINTSTFDGLQGVLYYHKLNDIYLASFWEKESVNSFTFKQNLSGITNLVSKADMYRIDKVMEFNSSKILMLLDQTKLATYQYPSVFQIKTIIEYNNARPTGGSNGGGESGACNGVRECSSTSEGWCIFQERQNGPTYANCYPKEDYCPNSTAISLLTLNGNTINESEINELYKIRNSFLMNSVKGMQYIDDYYYSSSFLRNNITLETALKLYELYGLDFFHRLSQFDNLNYNDSIIINNETKPLLLDLCDAATGITNDNRFNAIINRTRNDINLYHNKTLNYIINDF